MAVTLICLIAVMGLHHPPILPTRMPRQAKAESRVLYVAKHARWRGELHPEDGNHAPYHREIGDVLEGIGVRVQRANNYDALFDRPDVDFVFPLLNRGGFLNSEMLLPLLCMRHGIPFLGASPIVRGLSDDKHLAKLEAWSCNVPTAAWAVFRRGASIDPTRFPKATRWVIKPNASSASWGVRDASDEDGIFDAIEAIQADGHDAIVEPFLIGHDVEVPVILVKGRPRILPMMVFEQADPSRLRTYAEKRDLVPQEDSYRLASFDEPMIARRIRAMTEALIPIFHPFDYGRFEFRVDAISGDVRFMEVNLNCNLWSQKAFARSAAIAGLSHADLVETILTESMMRQGVLVSAEERQQGSRRLSVNG